MPVIETDRLTPVDAAGFAALPGVRDVAAQNGRIEFTVAGELDPVIKAAAHHNVRDIQINHPTLEEVFLTYYSDGEGR